jgi:acetolactate synthase-1/2/3 large subunit
MTTPRTSADTLARTLRDAGITRMYGLPGGEILEFIHAAKAAGIEFLLTRHEAAAAFMADVTGQIERRPGVCVATLGPGAMNMTLGVANAFLDRSPMIAITATMSVAASPYATHQNLDLNAVYRPFTKMAITLDGHNTAHKVQEAIRVSTLPRMGPVHIALPSDVARTIERESDAGDFLTTSAAPAPPPDADAMARLAALLTSATRPVVVLGLDLDPAADAAVVREFVEWFSAPVFVTPKAKGMLPEDHPLFYGVCAGVAGDGVIIDLFARSDLIVGLGFEPVESDKLWHETMKLVSIGPVSIAAEAYRPYDEVVAEVGSTLRALQQGRQGAWAWTPDELDRFRADLLSVLRPQSPLSALSPYELTRRLRELMPPDTVLATDVGAIKSITSQAWTTYEPMTFFESNGLSAMSYGLPAAMAARLAFPDRPVLCTIGDGGFGMTCAEIETCVRERLHFITVVYNDSSLSLIHVAQQNRSHSPYGVDHGAVDFATVAKGFGAWSRRVSTMAELDAAVREALSVNGPVVIDAAIDPTEYRKQNSAWTRG